MLVFTVPIRRGFDILTSCVYPTHMKRSNFFLPLPLLARLKAETERTGLSAAEIVRRALEAYLREQEGKQ